MPQELQAHLNKLLADAADCELISNLAVDRRKRAAFRRLAEQYKEMAERLRAEIVILQTPDNPVDEEAQRPTPDFRTG